jgi:hypothetical protein
MAKKFLGAFLAGGCAGVGTAIAFSGGIFAPLMMVLCLLITVIALGAAAGNIYFTKYAAKVPEPPAP